MAKSRQKEMRNARRVGQPRQPRVGEGWRTTDADEVERRRLRAHSEGLQVRPADVWDSLYGVYSVRSGEGHHYRVELRSLEEFCNSCGCPDWEVNGLGTCKHIEAVRHHLRGRQAPQRRAVSEIYVDRARQFDQGPRVRLLWADGLRANHPVRRTLDPYFDAGGVLLADPVDGVPAVEQAIRHQGLGTDRVRLSGHIGPWIERLRRERERREARSRFLTDVAAGKRDLAVVKRPLYEYQREGMLHLAFRERAILADEMGLGKTVQAVAACELLRRLRAVGRVLVISPVSLKTEWAEQIGMFTDAPMCILQGPRPERLRQYRQASFYYLANYEQVLYDGEDMQNLLAPDVIVLDEAQRIKNWQSKTAQAVKRLRSHYVFVLTGTPLENRIDEIYSIAQVLDPELFGSLFRFNRDFYQLDERGRPIGYKNLDELHRRLRPVLLRRRKQDVEGDLPGCTVNTYFVPMHAEQRLRYEEYSVKVARLVQHARRRPLSPEEFQRLQQWLACMRMLCDTPYILDAECRVSPKLEELKSILEEQLSGPDTKVIIFSEWTRMLKLVREHLEREGVVYAWHTGEVPQQRRRDEINRFKQDPSCRVFVSSDAGATGLNLQAANVVINLDLPWNPARLEQRIARAWRKHQQRAVTVINLVCEESIEHRILHLLEQKRSLAAEVLDGEGESEMALPSGRKMLVERLTELMETPLAAPAETGPDLSLDELPRELEARHPGDLEHLAVYGGERARTVFAVVHGEAQVKAAELSALLERCGEGPAALEVVDQGTMAVIQRLIDAGVLSFNAPRQTLHRGPDRERREREVRRAWLEDGRRCLGAAERKLGMAQVLANGGFEAEALASLREALDAGLAGLARALGALSGDSQEPVALETVQSQLLPRGGLGPEVIPLIATLRAGLGALQPDWLAGVATALAQIHERLDRWVLEG